MNAFTTTHPQERRPAGAPADSRLWLLGLLLLVQGLASQAMAQNITLKATGQPLAKVLKQLGRQAGKEVFYTQEQLQNARSVTVDIRNQPLEVALESVFKPQAFIYALANNTIVIKPRPVMAPKDGGPGPAW